MTRKSSQGNLSSRTLKKDRQASINSGYSIELLQGKSLTKEQTKACAKLLEDGGAVSSTTAENHLPNSYQIALVYRNREIVAVGAIKAPRIPYARKIQKGSQHCFDPNFAELGYVVVSASEQGHGLSGKIVKALLQKYSHPLFATTSKKRMKITLTHRGFKKYGKSWLGETRKIKTKDGQVKEKRSRLSLWMRCVRPIIHVVAVG